MVVFTNNSLIKMKSAMVSEKTVVEALKGGVIRPFHDLLVASKKYGSYDLYVTFKRQFNGDTLIISVKRRNNTRNIKYY